MLGALAPMLDDVLLAGSRLYTRLSGKVRGGPQRYGNLEHLGLFSAASQREIASAGMRPGGVLFGRPLAGVDRALGMFSSKALKSAIGFGAPLTALSVGMAPRGHKLSTALGQVSGLAGAQAGAAIGGLFGGLPGEVVGGIAGYALADLSKPFQSFAEAGRKFRRLDFGEGFRDSERAYTMRQRAAQELGASLVNARRYLGSEAAFMHQ